MLTEQDRDLIRTAAYGAVTLVACAYPGAISTTKASIAGARVLTGATGQAGKALAGKGKVNLPGASAADIADIVLPALTSAMAVLKDNEPGEADDFRRIVTIAVTQAAQSSGGGINAAEQEMISKITRALDA
jgi:hypothetical protein